MPSYETPTIQARKRDRTGTSYSRRLRRHGQLPAVIYGHKRDTIHVSVDATLILSYIKGGAHVLALEVEGTANPETCLVKELQFGYLGDDVVHIDFTRVNLDEEVNVQVHLNHVGEPSGLKPGAIVSHDLTSLQVTCKVNAIPDEIRVDLAVMGDEMQILTIGDLTLPPAVKAVEPPETPVVRIIMLKVEEEPVGEEVEVTGEAEPEVISEKPEEGQEAKEKESE